MINIPNIGLGTWQAKSEEVGRAIEYAITEAGYRHIDCAARYKNEKAIGEALAKVFASGIVKREDVFVTSKLWNTHHAPDDVEKACRQTLEDLQLDSLDLYLMHWGMATVPNDALDERGVIRTLPISILETWKAMEDLREIGLVKHIGVSNFTCMMLLDLLASANVRPAMNQIELHPYLQQNALIDFCKQNEIALTAYSPLGSPGSEGDMRILDDEVVVEIAKRHRKTPAQVLLKWGVGRETTVIPKSTSLDRIKENIDLDFELSEEDVLEIASLDRSHRFVDPSDWWGIPYFN